MDFDLSTPLEQQSLTEEEESMIFGAPSGPPDSIGGAHAEGVESIKVLVRVRPLSVVEKNENNDSVVHVLSDNSLNVTSSDGKKSFRCSFDSVLSPESTQSEVYRIVKGCTESVLEGFNSTIFAYGQTGSGKTYSMYGPPSYQPTTNNSASTSFKVTARDTQTIGIIPRAISEIFELARSKAQSIQDFQVHCSFVQIYNENLFDMLRDASMNTPLAVREDHNEMYVQGLSEYNVKSVSDTLQLLRIAEENRAIRETHMNMFSSRSHSIFQVMVEYKRVDTADSDNSSLAGSGEVTVRAKFNLVDLAGSEKWNTRQYMRDEHIAEMTNINLSLTTLGKCISSLAKASKHSHRAAAAQQDQTLRASASSKVGGGSFNASGVHGSSVHIPFRESKLTRLLQDSLGGNAKTFLIATVSPARSNADETISTLKFADRAKQVMVQARINESRPVDHALVKRLQQEVDMLKSLLKRMMQQQASAVPKRALASSDAASGDDLVARINCASRADELQHIIEGDFAHDITHRGDMPQSLGVAAPEKGSGMEYIISLEKALNQEQIHSQHLIKKNETLIKELENMKFSNMQLNGIRPQQGEIVDAGAIAADRYFRNRQGRFGDGASSQLDLTAGLQRSQSLESTLPKRAESCASRGGISVSTAQAEQVIASVQLLLQEHETVSNLTEQMQKVLKKFFKFQIEEDEMKTQVTEIFAKLKQHRNGGAAKQVNDNFSFLEFLATAATDVSRTPPQLEQTNTENQDLQSQSVGKSKGKTKKKSPHNTVHEDFEEIKHPGYSAHSPTHGNVVDQHSRPYSGDTGELHGMTEVPHQLNVSYRVRRGAASKSGAETGNSLQSSGGWVTPMPEEEAEEALKRELRKAKKKMKRQQQIEEWQKEKEQRLEAQMKAAEDEKRAAVEAEKEKENRRRAHAERQKQKLANYQMKVKSEAEKLKELAALGIDPASLQV